MTTGRQSRPSPSYPACDMLAQLLTDGADPDAAMAKVNAENHAEWTRPMWEKALSEGAQRKPGYIAAVKALRTSSPKAREDQARILACITQNPGWNAVKIAHRAHMDETKTRRVLTDLHAAGKIRSEAAILPNRAPLWFPMDKPMDNL